MTLTDAELEFLLKAAKALGGTGGTGDARLQLMMKMEKELKERRQFRAAIAKEERDLAAVRRMAAED